jgi:hypothetical protein
MGNYLALTKTRRPLQVDLRTASKQTLRASDQGYSGVQDGELNYTGFHEIIEKVAFNQCDEWHNDLDVSWCFNLFPYWAPCRGVHIPWQD